MNQNHFHRLLIGWGQEGNRREFNYYEEAGILVESYNDVEIRQWLWKNPGFEPIKGRMHDYDHLAMQRQGEV